MQDQRETCEIEATYTDAERGHARFWANARGPEGQYNASESAEFVCTMPIEDDIQSQECLRELIRELVEHGWEPADDRGAYWYSYRFTRRIAP